MLCFGGDYIRSIANQLEEMGFVKGEIAEVIVSTISTNGDPNAAPMGVWVQPGPVLILRPFTSSQTAKNLNAVPEAVFHITDDPQWFLKTAFKHELTEESQIEFEAAHKVKPPRLAHMPAYIEVEVKSNTKALVGSTQLEFQCQVQHITVLKRIPRVHSRIRSAAIECVIHATRVRAFHTTDSETTHTLIERINELHAFVNRAAPNSDSARVIQDVLQIVNQWVE